MDWPIQKVNVARRKKMGNCSRLKDKQQIKCNLDPDFKKHETSWGRLRKFEYG